MNDFCTQLLRSFIGAAFLGSEILTRFFFHVQHPSRHELFNCALHRCTTVYTTDKHTFVRVCLLYFLEAEVVEELAQIYGPRYLRVTLSLSVTDVHAHRSNIYEGQKFQSMATYIRHSTHIDAPIQKDLQ